VIFSDVRVEHPGCEKPSELDNPLIPFVFGFNDLAKGKKKAPLENPTKLKFFGGNVQRAPLTPRLQNEKYSIHCFAITYSIAPSSLGAEI